MLGQRISQKWLWLSSPFGLADEKLFHNMVLIFSCFVIFSQRMHQLKVAKNNNYKEAM